MSPAEIDAADVLQSYLTLLAAQSITVRAESELQYPKEIIREVLRHCLSIKSDQDTRARLEGAYMNLAAFQQLNDDELKAIGLYEGGGNPCALSDKELTALASAIAQCGDTYQNLQRRVLDEQQELLTEIKKFRGE